MAEACISNLAWAVEQDAAVAEILKRHGLNCVELAPGKYWPDLSTVTAAEVHTVRSFWNDRGLQVAALQAILFGKPELQLFSADLAVRQACSEHLTKVLHVARDLGARTIVFGSPKNRLRGALSQQQADAQACEFFLALAAEAQRCAVSIAIEANPAEYGGDYVLTTSEALHLAELVDHAAIGVNYDLGGMQLAAENIEQQLEFLSPVIKHIHFSAPRLTALDFENVSYLKLFKKIAASDWQGAVSIEMLTSPADNLLVIEKTIAAAYGK